MRSKKIIIPFYILAFIVYSCNFFAAGSYTKAERYEFDIPFEELKRKIQEFKKENPEYRVFLPNAKGEIYEPGGYVQNIIGQANKITETQNDSATWYICYFYFDDIKAAVHCAINISKTASDYPVEIKLTGITYSQNFAEWKEINTTDLTKEENKTIKKKFETKILDHLDKWRRPD